MFLGRDNEGIGPFVFILREIEKSEHLIKRLRGYRTRKTSVSLLCLYLYIIYMNICARIHVDMCIRVCVCELDNLLLWVVV